ncbi:MAG: helix-turn-helix domain-containing protein [Rhizobiaceae bacterium]
MPTEHRYVTSPLGADNQHINIGDLQVGERCILHLMKSSGYQICSAESPRSDFRSDMVKVAMIKQGHVEIRRRTDLERIGPGDIYFIASTDVHSTITESEIVRLIFPAGILQSLASRSGEFFVVREREPVAQVLSAMFSGLQTSLREGGPNSEMLSRIAIDLTSRVFEDHINSSAISGYDIVRERAREYIHDNITNPELGIDEIAAYAGASRATLYRAFRSLGGVREYITFVRVEMARAMIGAGAPDRGGVSKIAYACGFSSPAQLGKSFKTRFGASPTKLT